MKKSYLIYAGVLILMTIASFFLFTDIEIFNNLKDTASENESTDEGGVAPLDVEITEESFFIEIPKSELEDCESLSDNERLFCEFNLIDSYEEKYGDICVFYCTDDWSECHVGIQERSSCSKNKKCEDYSDLEIGVEKYCNGGPEAYKDIKDPELNINRTPHCPEGYIISSNNPDKCCTERAPYYWASESICKSVPENSNDTEIDSNERQRYIEYNAEIFCIMIGAFPELHNENIYETIPQKYGFTYEEISVTNGVSGSVKEKYEKDSTIDQEIANTTQELCPEEYNALR